MRVPALIQKELESCGVSYRIEQGSQHWKIFVGEVLCGIFPLIGKSPCRIKCAVASQTTDKEIERESSLMARRWREHEIEKMLDYRDQGLTEKKIAEKLSLIFMRKFTASAVNRKVRDLKKIGYIEANEHSGRWRNPLGLKRTGEIYAKQKPPKKSKPKFNKQRP